MESDPSIEPQVIYQHPLAYLLGLEGIALLHAFAGDYDRDFTLARFDEIRALLDAAEELGDGVTVDAIPTTEGYGTWAEFYDEPGNQLIDLDSQSCERSSTACRAASHWTLPAARADTAPISPRSATR